MLANIIHQQAFGAVDDMDDESAGQFAGLKIKGNGVAITAQDFSPPDAESNFIAVQLLGPGKSLQGGVREKAQEDNIKRKSVFKSVNHTQKLGGKGRGLCGMKYCGGLPNFNPMEKKLPASVFCGLLIIFSSLTMQAQTVIPLYAGEIPNGRPGPDREHSWYERDSILIVSRVSRPTLTIFLPKKERATGEAVIICPGGGYTNLAMGYEGTEVAQRFNQSGIAAFVLKYRIPDTSTMYHKEIGPLQDAQRAIQILRSRAREWGINPHRIGIMGFSAGGHLAATAGTHFQKDYIPNPDKISLRPDFLLLIYPVISFRPPIAHMGSRENLIGPEPTEAMIKDFSNEEQVRVQGPPAYLVHARDDDAVPYANSMVFTAACKKQGVPVEVYLYEKGGHGFGMNNKTSPQLWMNLCIAWLEHH